MGKGKPSEIWKEIKPRIGDMVAAANDMEQSFDKAVREAYEKGYLDAVHNYHEMCDFLDDEKKEAYQRGLNDAWETARKIIRMPEGDLLNLFTECYSAVCTSVQVFLKYDASECIEKIWQYEESKEKHTWICSEVNEPSVDTTLICSECGYTITIKPGDTQALNFCPKCGDCKKPKEEES